MPDRDELVRELDRLRKWGESRSDLPSGFIGAECRVAHYALMQANDALSRDEVLGGLYYLRLITECAIRVRWMVGDGPDLGDEEGRPLADRGTLAERERRLRKRDLLHLAAAYEAIHKADGSPSPYAGQIRDEAALIQLPAAPWDVGRMATSPTATKLYAGHRLCSSMIHPGLALLRGALMPGEQAEEMINEAAYLCAAWADAALRSLDVPAN